MTSEGFFSGDSSAYPTRIWMVLGIGAIWTGVDLGICSGSLKFHRVILEINHLPNLSIWESTPFTSTEVQLKLFCRLWVDENCILWISKQQVFKQELSDVYICNHKNIFFALLKFSGEPPSPPFPLVSNSRICQKMFWRSLRVTFFGLGTKC